MPHELTDKTFPGLDPERYKQLTSAGIGSLEELIEAGPTKLSQRTSLDVKVCRLLIRGARTLLTREARAEAEAPAPSPAVAALEAAVAMVRKASTHVGRLPTRERWAEAHARAVRQLRKLLVRLQALLESAEPPDVTAALSELLAALEPLLAQPVRKKTLKALRRVARRTRHQLTA